MSWALDTCLARRGADLDRLPSDVAARLVAVADALDAERLSDRELEAELQAEVDAVVAS